tara:strand:+ start:181 stop:351 length:171 start_codon:yes stop_codon:yes gene_type:complete
MTTEEKLQEVQARFDENLAKARELEKRIEDLQSQMRQLQQPLIEDQGAIKILNELL